MRTVASAALLTMLLASSCSAQTGLVGGPCEGCEAVFEYADALDRPLSPTDTLPGFTAAKQKLLLRGRVLMPDGVTPADNVILYIWHTNEAGEYAAGGDESGWGRRHGQLRSWIRTGKDGKYAFYTRLPGHYSSNPAHVHPLILEPDGKYYYLEAWFFEGDPNYDPDDHSEGGRGGAGLVSLNEENGLLVAERDIVLGLNVPGYDDAR